MNNTTAHRSCEAGDGQQQEQVVHGLVAAGLLASAAGQLMVTAGLLCIARSSVSIALVAVQYCARSGALL